MLARSFTTPTVGRCWVRGLGSILAPARAHALEQTALVQDSVRPFSAAFPSHALNFQDRLQRPLYALHVQSASKASLPQDPERPKRPLSGYFRFAAVQREKNGLKKVAEIGAAWKQASPAEKQPFEQAAAADLAKHRVEFDKYKASGKLDAWKRDPAKPKKPLVPFMAWAQQERLAPDMAKLPVAQAGKILGSNWAKLPADKKAPFEATFKAAKPKYEADMKVYRDSGAETAWLKRTGRLEIMQKAEATKQAQKDKIKEAKVKKMESDAKAKEKAKSAKGKAAAAKAAKAKAAKVKASLAKAKTAKAAKAKAAKAQADKAKDMKAKAATAKAAKAKATNAKAAKVKADKDRAAKAAKAKTDKEKAAKVKAATAAKTKAAKQKLVVAKAAKAAKAKAGKAKHA